MMNILERRFEIHFHKIGRLFINYQDYRVVLVLMKTWFTNNIASDFERYQAPHFYRTNRFSGGLSVYVKDKLIYEKNRSFIFSPKHCGIRRFESFCKHDYFSSIRYLMHS